MFFLSHKSLLHLIFLGRLRSNHVRRNPLFEIDFWIMNRRVTQSSMKTNNSVETYHRRIGSVFQCAHTTLWVFMQKLIDEENITHVDILQVCACQSPKKKKLNDRFERRLFNLLANLHQDLSVQIDSIAHNISL